MGRVHTLCGIPQILLEGSAEDWQNLGRRVREWGRFDLNWWLKPLQPILDQFIAALQPPITVSISSFTQTALR